MVEDEDDFGLSEADLDELTPEQKKLLDERLGAEENFNPNDTIPSHTFSAVGDEMLDIGNRIKDLQDSKSPDIQEAKCSFCGKAQSNVKKLLQAESGASICNVCVLACMNELIGPDDA